MSKSGKCLNQQQRSNNKSNHHHKSSTSSSSKRLTNKLTTNHHSDDENSNSKSPQSSSTITQLINYIKSIITSLIGILMTSIMMVNNSSSNTEPNLLSSKKEAKLRNKQNKLMAEYRLVTGKKDNNNEEEEEEGGDEEDGGGGGGVVAKKKMKLDGGSESSGKKKKLLNEEDFKAMKLELAERKRVLQNLPRFRISSSHSGLQASIFLTPYATRTPLLLSDIQHLLTYTYGGNDLVTPPSRWCQMQKPNKLLQVVVLVVEGVGLTEFVDNEDKFGRVMGVFGGNDEEDNRGIFEVLDPGWYGGSLFGEVGGWGILGRSNNQHQVNNLEESGVVKTEAGQIQQQQHQNFSPILNQLRSVFPIEKASEEEVPAAKESNDKFPRTQLLLSLPQLISENYPLPIPANTLTRNTPTEYKLTAPSYPPVTPNSKMFAIDCEMCEAVGDQNALIRIGVVDEKLETVYETLVKPEGKVLDYRTRWSGVSKGMMEGVEVRLGDVQEKLCEIVGGSHGCILVGQSLNCDLRAVRLLHPYIIDTSTIFNLTGIAGRKSSLKDLSLNLLDEIIQSNHRDGGGGERKSNQPAIIKVKSQNGPQGESQVVGHCPVEDARAAMKLVKAKLASGFCFGNVLLKPSVTEEDDDTGESTKKSVAAAATAVPTTFGLVDTLVCVEDSVVKSKLASGSNNNKMDKDVLIVTQQQSPEDEEHEASSSSFPFANNNDDNNPTSSSSSTTNHHRSKLLKTTTNGNVIKLMHSNFLESYLTVGFYKLNEETSEDFGKTLGKLDKRVEKLYNRMCFNSVLVVVCGGGGRGDGKKKADGKRRNNAVCFVRIKVDSSSKRRRD